MKIFVVLCIRIYFVFGVDRDNRLIDRLTDDMDLRISSAATANKMLFIIVQCTFYYYFLYEISRLCVTSMRDLHVAIRYYTPMTTVSYTHLTLPTIYSV